MYDTPGADTGHEWIELTNTGSETVDIGKYKLFENDTNHSLTLISGSSVLSAGQAAIVASDPNKFKIDNPTFSGTLFDSTFSLSNTGETLVIKDASSTTLNTASYSTTEDANGTGGTLQLKGSAFVAALASPGVYPGQFTPVPKAPVKEKAAPKTTKKSTSSSTAKTSTYSATKNSDAQKESAFSEAGVAAAAAAAAIPAAWLWGLGLFAVILLGVGGIFFIQLGKRETSLSVEEFTIE